MTFVLAVLRSLCIWLRLARWEQKVARFGSSLGYDEWEKRGGLWWPR